MTIKEFPNKLGMNVTSGNACFEVWYPDGTREDYRAKRIDRNGYGIAYLDGIYCYGTREEAAQAVLLRWREDRGAWKPCQN